MSNRTVVITGASKGIGEATALHLDRLGFRVFAGVRSEADAARLTEQGSERLTPITLDVTDQSHIDRAVRAVREAGPHELLGLVNNAAISAPGPLEFVPIDEFRAQLEVNLVGYLAVTQAFLPLIRKAEDRRLVNVSSINGRLAWRYIGPYIASKHALEGMSDTFRMELARWKIQVSVVQPGAIDTPIFQTSRERGREVAQEYPERARELYPGVVNSIMEREGRAPKHALPPQRVAQVIAKALTVRRPKTRYIVGWDARLGIFLRHILPDRAIDWLMDRAH
jgi:NAD(P)-dependent dehydrogenase (short-subunit alcohol dehydrogenase family)